MPDDLRAAAERVVDDALLATSIGVYSWDRVGALLDAFLASPECLALAVREACEPTGYRKGNAPPDVERYRPKGDGWTVVYAPKPDVAAFLGGV